MKKLTFIIVFLLLAVALVSCDEKVEESKYCEGKTVLSITGGFSSYKVNFTDGSYCEFWSGDMVYATYGQSNTK